MAKAWCVKRADDLPDDDDEAIYRLTGGLFEGKDFERREESLLPERHCKPWMKGDPEMTERFKEAVRLHAPRCKRILAHEQETFEALMEKIENGEIKDLDDIPQELVLNAIVDKMADARSHNTQLNAAKLLAEMKGMTKQTHEGAMVDKLDELILAAKKPKLRKVD